MDYSDAIDYEEREAISRALTTEFIFADMEREESKAKRQAARQHKSKAKQARFTFAR